MMDRRQKKSREAIFEAFSSLIMQKEYSEITVQDITEKANVGRSTFYAHFDTKDALLKEVCTSLFDHVVRDHAEAEKTHDFSGGKNDTDSMITHILYHVKDNRYNITGILHGESGSLFLHYFKQYLTGIFRNEFHGRLRKTDVPEDYLYHHISCSFVDTLNWWIEDGMKESPETVEHYFRSVTGLGNLFSEKD
ncbi:MAG: TetR/AcrR family transcriptional regulator [Lachnospiraceae bacterium]|nr:TetR/AcrR family transcriptional regulator [Lachnospiraceae bacterium]